MVHSFSEDIRLGDDPAFWYIILIRHSKDFSGRTAVAEFVKNVSEWGIEMPIEFKNGRFHLFNGEMSYIIEISKQKDLLKLHFGGRAEPEEIALPENLPGAFYCCADDKDDNYSLSVLAQEYPSAGASDFRAPAYEIEANTGAHTPELKYKKHRIVKGKPHIDGLPSVYTEGDDEAETLMITTEDKLHGIEVKLYYTIFNKLNVICRHSKIVNTGHGYISVDNAQSVSVDFPPGDYEYIHLEGAWAREKHVERNLVSKGFQGFESKRGASGHSENPFLMFFDKGSDEDHGNVYGISLIYSGNHRFLMERCEYGSVRVQAGINPFNFRFKLDHGESLVTPEAVIVYSQNGFSEMSHTFHELYRTRLCRGYWRDKPRPIVVNNWEATYFDFTKDKLMAIADIAAQIGIELFVLDDGWFGRRNDERSSLGDWYSNEKKLGGTLKELAREINDRGLKFGLWIEPEMISEDSDLYRMHPDWAIRIPGAKRHYSRHQFVLDYTRSDVREYILDRMTGILKSANIEYVKWDMNRNMSDVYSNALENDRQGEFYHRYILGLYEVLERITSAFPEILFEGCSGGGGRNDPGMLYYMPQNWISDDTDASERLYIQYGCSMVYPPSSWSCHVSAVPNHQIGRMSPLSMRGIVSMNGAFGYELDLSSLREEELYEMRSQIILYKRIRGLVMIGRYYRLIDPYKTGRSAWMYVSEDKKRAVVCYVVIKAQPSNEILYLRLKGLGSETKYSVGERTVTGRTLMNFGIVIDSNEKDGDHRLFELSAVE